MDLTLTFGIVMIAISCIGLTMHYAYLAWASSSKTRRLIKYDYALYQVKKTDILDLPKYDWFEIGYKFYFIVKRKYLNKMTKREKFSFISDILRKGRPIRADGFIYNIATYYVSNDRVIIETEEMSGISETLYTKEIKNNG